MAFSKSHHKKNKLISPWFKFNISCASWLIRFPVHVAGYQTLLYFMFFFLIQGNDASLQSTTGIIIYIHCSFVCKCIEILCRIQRIMYRVVQKSGPLLHLPSSSELLVSWILRGSPIAHPPCFCQNAHDYLYWQAASLPNFRTSWQPSESENYITSKWFSDHPVYS